MACQLGLFEELASEPKRGSHRNPPAVVDQLLADYWDWAAKVAIEMHRGRLGRHDREDLVQDARIGLWKAAMRWDPTSKVRFPVYAVRWVKGEVQMDTRRGAHLNAHMKTTEGMRDRGEAPKINVAEGAALSHQSRLLLGYVRADFTLMEIAGLCGLTITEVEEAMKTLEQEAKFHRGSE